MLLKKYSHLIWDWNGTLLDDAWLCVDVMNGMLLERDLPLMTVEKYRDMFDFPVMDYYEKLGYNFEIESFEKVGMDFMILYNQRQDECSLHEDVPEILETLSKMGMRQAILSAREQNELRRETVQLGVAKYFDLVYGLDDHYAHGKTDVGVKLLADLGIPKEKILFIGDTGHDAEVAGELGIDCILIPNGHHSEERLLKLNRPVIHSLKDILNLK